MLVAILTIATSEKGNACIDVHAIYSKSVARTLHCPYIADDAGHSTLPFYQHCCLCFWDLNSSRIVSYSLFMFPLSPIIYPVSECHSPLSHIQTHTCTLQHINSISCSPLPSSFNTYIRKVPHVCYGHIYTVCLYLAKFPH